MLKKLLTLCLALAMLSSVALASPQTITLAAETEDVPEILEAVDPISLTQDDMEFLLADTDGYRQTDLMPHPVVTYSVNKRHNLKYNTGKTNEGGAELFLVKANIGRDDLSLKHSVITFNAYIRAGGTDSYTAHVAPLTKTQYDTAAAAVESGASVSGLPTPSTAEDKDSSASVEITKNNYEALPVTITGSFYGADNYVDGYLYMAVEWTHESTGPAQVDSANHYQTKNISTPFTLNVEGKRIVDSSSTTWEDSDREITTEDMEFLLYDEETYKTTPFNWTNTSRIGLKRESDWNDWILVKIDVGNWDLATLTSFKLKTKMYINSTTASYQPYVAPISEEAYYAAKKGALTETTKLTAPSLLESDTVSEAAAFTGTGAKPFPDITLTPGNFNAESYSGGSLYLAVEYVVNQNDDTNSFAGFGKNNEGCKEGWSLCIAGKELVISTPAVDDFSDAVVNYDNSTGEYTITTATTTGEAYLIIASFTGNAMNDVELVAINAAEGLSGRVTPLDVDAGTIKIFLWNKATLAPATAVQ